MDITIIITEYKHQLKARGYAERTIDLYRWGLDLFSDYLKENGIDDMRVVGKSTIVDYQARVMGEPLAGSTKAIKIRCVKRLFEYLTEQNRLLINPAEGITETKPEKNRIGTVLTQDEVQKVLAQPNLSRKTGIRDRTIMEVLYATGIRSEELLRLEVYHVDLKDEVLYIRKGKGKKQRVVPLSEAAVMYLTEYINKVRPHHGRKNPKERRLFLNDEGRPMTWNNVRSKLYGHGVTAGIKKNVSAHVFRRSCATHLMQNGADIRYVQKLLGHKYLSTTQKYVKVMPVDVKKSHKEYHPNEDKRHHPRTPQIPAGA